jgi:uncharacterized protein YndB with AHSA1/START domain/DNA-binding transcriptional ArsR family regulator
MEQEHVFKALADAHRRTLLDRLFQQDGQTLSELCVDLPMTRYGVMKHLAILAEAGLISTRKVGREKLHYLNPVPIQQVYDRWVSKYSQPIAQHLVNLKQILEEPPMAEKLTHVYAIFIRTSPQRLWQALTDGAMTPQYYFGTSVDSSWQAGAPYQYTMPDGFIMLSGTVVEADAPRKLVLTFRPGWPTDEAEPHESTVTYEIEPMGEICKLTLTHEGLVAGSDLTRGVIDSWAQILSALKTLVETGEPMPALPAN